MSESGKVVVTKTKLDELANRINEKAGSTGPKTIAELTQTVENMPSPTDLSGKQDKIMVSGLLKGDGAGGVSTAVPGTDYMAPMPVTASDNGKFLRVVNGTWAAAAIDNANGVSF